jgi:hypothetical protein
MSAIRYALATVLTAAAFAIEAQAPATLDLHAAQRVAALEAEVNQLRAELARLRVPTSNGTPDWNETYVRPPRPPGVASPWRPYGPGQMPPLSPLQAQWAWVQPPFAGLVTPFGAAGANCVPCPACTDSAYTMRR